VFPDQIGGFAEAPAKMNHYEYWSYCGSGPRSGPFAINYVDPADGPSKK